MQPRERDAVVNDFKSRRERFCYSLVSELILAWRQELVVITRPRDVTKAHQRVDASSRDTACLIVTLFCSTASILVDILESSMRVL